MGNAFDDAGKDSYRDSSAGALLTLIATAAATGITAGTLGLLGGGALFLLGMGAGPWGGGAVTIGFLLAIAALPALVTGLVLRRTVSAIGAAGSEQPSPDAAARTV